MQRQGVRRISSKNHNLVNRSLPAKLLVKVSSRAQSAMEYLMTYGWAILIIAVVLGALFQLGVFNGNNFAPKAPPGACQVFRPNGPGTTFDINLEGECQGELPEYVAQFDTGAYVVIPIAPMNNSQHYTLTMWINMLNVTTPNGGIIYSNGNPYTQLQIGITPSNTLFAQIWNNSASTWDGFYSGEVVPIGTWVFVAMNYSSTTGTATLFLNGIGQTGHFWELYNTKSYVSGIGINVGYYTENQGYQGFKGYISNVQVYNASLVQQEIQTIYKEGIGGAPIDLQNLVGWWPLNGNANDYSGNGNNGVPGNVVFVSNWWQGYTPP